MFTGFTVTTGTGRFLVQSLEWGEPLDQLFDVGDRVSYRVGDRFHEWEKGTGTYRGEGIVSRDTVVESSNNKTCLVNFGCGTKIIHLMEYTKWQLKNIPTFSDDEIEAGTRALFSHMLGPYEEWLNSSDFTHAVFRCQVVAVLKGITEHRKSK